MFRGSLLLISPIDLKASGPTAGKSVVTDDVTADPFENKLGARVFCVWANDIRL